MDPFYRMIDVKRRLEDHMHRRISTDIANIHDVFVNYEGEGLDLDLFHEVWAEYSGQNSWRR
jgi:hypothetical protein